jgi:hypothetical protein
VSEHPIAGFNGDFQVGRPVAQHRRRYAIFIMNWHRRLERSQVLSVDPAWQVTTVGDFNGDGKVDLLWRSTAGATAIWLMNGTSVTSPKVLSADPACN